jgi:hypothetical protein
MSVGVVTSQFTDPVLRGSLMETFRVSNESREFEWKKCGFEEMTSDKAFEEIAEFAGLGLAPRREELAQGAVDIVKQGYTVRINQFAYSINMPVSREAQKFKQYRDAIMGTESVNESLHNSVEILCADVFANAFSTTIGLLPDGKPICSLAHKLPRGGTFDTVITAASIGQTSIEAMMILAAKMPGGHGIPVGVKLKKLVIPEELKFEAKRVLQSQLQFDTVNNAVNALKDEGLAPVTNRYLASTSNWFGVTDAKLGLLVIWTEKPNLVEVGMDLNRATVYSGNMMLGIAAVNPRRLLGSNI